MSAALGSSQQMTFHNWHNIRSQKRDHCCHFSKCPLECSTFPDSPASTDSNSLLKTFAVRLMFASIFLFSNCSLSRIPLAFNFLVRRWQWSSSYVHVFNIKGCRFESQQLRQHVGKSPFDEIILKIRRKLGSKNTRTIKVNKILAPV